MPESHARRRAALRCRIEAIGGDVALVTDLVNIRYLTGFTGSNAALLVGADADRDLFCTDGRYVTQSQQEVPDLPLHVDRFSAAAVVSTLDGQVGTVAFESHVVPVDEARALAEQAPSVRWASLAESVEALRAAKDDDEVELIRHACAIADQALSDLADDGGVAPGRTERAIALDLDFRMLRLGAEAVSFETIVATGPHSAIPHHSPTDREVAAGDLLKVDFGATYAGYHSDMTRTFAVRSVAGWQRDLYDLVAEAQRRGRESLAIGTAARAVDRAARGVIVEAGYGAQFGHGLGHGVGLQVHEAPWLREESTATLDDRTAVTVEPGVYLPGRGGVRIEDILVLRADPMSAGGTRTEVLTMTTRELVVL